jgi:hypothetical protein
MWAVTSAAGWNSAATAFSEASPISWPASTEIPPRRRKGVRLGEPCGDRLQALECTRRHAGLRSRRPRSARGVGGETICVSIVVEPYEWNSPQAQRRVGRAWSAVAGRAACVRRADTPDGIGSAAFCDPSLLLRPALCAGFFCLRAAAAPSKRGAIAQLSAIGGTGRAVDCVYYSRP